MINLEGTELTIVGYDDPNYQHRMKIFTHPNGSVEFVEGMCHDLLLALQFTLKFRYKAVAGSTWWGKEANGTIIGMTGQVHRGEVDISIAQASMVMMTPATEFISFLIPTSYQRLSAIFRQPRSSQDILGSVFRLEIWGYWALVWAAVITTLAVFHGIYKRKRRGNEWLESRSEIILWCVSSICCQGWYNQPSQGCLKGVLLAGLSFAFLFSIFFSASLTSNLATETIPIKTFDDLSGKSGLSLYGDKRLPVVRDIIQEAYVKKRRRFFSKSSDLESYYIRISESYKILKSSAFITFEDAAKSLDYVKSEFNDVEYFCNNIYALGVSSRFIPGAMFIRKGSKLKEIFNRKITLLSEVGITFRLNAIYNRKTLVVCSVSGDSYRGNLGFADISLAYFTAFGGFFLSASALIFEKWMNWNVHHAQQVILS